MTVMDGYLVLRSIGISYMSPQLSMEAFMKFSHVATAKAIVYDN